jgi:ABC-type uncharacterized transport system permease subunit
VTGRDGQEESKIWRSCLLLLLLASGFFFVGCLNEAQGSIRYAVFSLLVGIVFFVSGPLHHCWDNPDVGKWAKARGTRNPQNMFPL